MLAKIKIDRFNIIRLGQDAPEIVAQTLDEEDFKLSELRGKVVLLDFWATWCGPCVKEFPNVRAVRDEFGKNGDFVVIGISLDKNEKDVRKFLKKQSADWTHIVGGPKAKNPIAKAYNVEGVPATFLIDRDGKIVAKDLHGHRLHATVRRLMKQASVTAEEKKQKEPTVAKTAKEAAEPV